MAQGLVTYPGVSFPKGATYTQTRGVEPDSISLRLVPQTTPIPSVGNITMYFGSTDMVTIRDCLADKSNIWLSKSGFTGTVVFQDRRWRWSRTQGYSAHINERNANGEIIQASKYSLRAILWDLFNWIGESNVDVSRVSDSFYPELDYRCVKADEKIEDLCNQYGYTVCLGFGTQPVEVWPLHVGRYVNTASPQIMRISSAVDPADPVYHSSVCFGPSEAQARFLAVPVGMDTDGTWKKIEDLSYKPAAGWVNEPAHTMANVESEHGKPAAKLARQTVFRWYAPIGFANGNNKWTYNYPDGSGALSHISQCYPFAGKLLETDFSPTGQPVHPRPRVYGEALESRPRWHPALTNQDIGDEIEGSFIFDRNTGIVQFEDPQLRHVSTGSNPGLYPAIVYLEAAFKIRDVQTRQFVSYVHNKVVNASGFGVHMHDEPGMHSRTITNYSSGQTPSGTTTNKTELDNHANLLHMATTGLYTSSQKRVIHYNKLMAGARCDGLTSQIQHVISDGTGAGINANHTVIAQNMDYDMFIRSAQERSRDRHLDSRRKEWVVSKAKQWRSEKANE